MEQSLEQRYADLLRGGADNSPLATDGYKFSMAQAGAPLRRESFYLHFRKGGPQFIPFDFEALVKALRPRHPNSREQGFLTANGYGLTPAMEAALDGDLTVQAIPAGSWANEQEPVALVRGPSFLVSWLEAMLIATHFPIQVATQIYMGKRDFEANCEDEAAIIRLVYEAMWNHLMPQETREPLSITVYEDAHRTNVREQIGKLSTALGGEVHRAFEVGTRAMTCMAQHRIVLEECKAAGIHRTANVKLAYDLYMVPVGTTGHEHQKRWGSDIDAFRAVRDMRPEPPSYLFDTFDPMRSGIPAAVQTMLEDRTRRCSVRFDSGDQEAQLHEFVEAHREYGINPFYLFMDGYGDERVAQMEGYAGSLAVSSDARHYGLGGFLVADTSAHDFTRNALAMVYKLTSTGGPGYDGITGRRDVMKYSGTPGKSSLPGLPFVLVAGDGSRYICQEGEGFMPESGVWQGPRRPQFPSSPSILSPATEALIAMCRERDLGRFQTPGPLGAAA